MRWPRGVAGVAVVVLALVGCRTPVTEDDQKVQESLEEAARQARHNAQEALDEAVLPALSADAAVVAFEHSQECRAGRRGLMKPDPFDLECSTSHTIVVDVADSDTFTTFATDAHERLESLEWSDRWQDRQGRGLLRVLNEYAAHVGTDRDRPGLIAGTVSYGPQHFPSVDYYYGDTPGRWQLRIGFSGPDDRFLHGRDKTFTRQNGDEVSARELVEGFSPDGYALLVTVTRWLSW